MERREFIVPNLAEGKPSVKALGAGGAKISCGKVAISDGHQKIGMQDMDVIQDMDGM